ncbi:MAG: TetR/AcrR family transcriptional regulator [Candidatus Riflebacteria bacterium]|nr:TetR/AcrR family transcriptional regulator [Candidatus Riflebacteria bacterium]
MGDRLLDVAQALFARQGYAGTSVSEIVAAAGVTQPMLYYYFANKQALFEALFDRARASFQAVLRQPFPAGRAARERLTDLCRRLVEEARTAPWRVRLLLMVWSGFAPDAPGRPGIETLLADFQALIGTMVEEGVRQGEFVRVPALEIAWGVSALCIRAMEEAVHDPAGSGPPPEVERLVGHFLAGITIFPNRFGNRA